MNYPAGGPSVVRPPDEGGPIPPRPFARSVDTRSRNSLAAGFALLLFFLASLHWRLHWLSASDWSVIAILALFLLATEGLKESGYLNRLVSIVAERELPEPALFAWLIAASGVLAAAVTNDVSLFVIVPLTLGICHRRGVSPIAIVVLETMAANVGSMSMPWGNPQNLFLFRHYSLAAGGFYRLTLPLSLTMMALICAAGRRIARPGNVRRDGADAAPVSHFTGILFSVILIAASLQLLRLLPAPAEVLMGVAVAAAALANWRVLLRTDWSLPALFAVIFVVVNGIRVSAVGPWLDHLFHSGSWIQTYVLAAGVSQGISNVPTALIASGGIPIPVAGSASGPISSGVAALLMGVNVGGLGTPLASLANLIAARLFVTGGGSAREFYRTYWPYNLIGLALFSVLGLVALYLIVR